MKDGERKESFTAGPWVIQKKGDQGCRDVIGPDGGMRVCVIQRFTGCDQANAALISSAPELYKLIVEFNALFERASNDTEYDFNTYMEEFYLLNNQAEELLAKARGEA